MTTKDMKAHEGLNFRVFSFVFFVTFVVKSGSGHAEKSVRATQYGAPLRELCPSPA